MKNLLNKRNALVAVGSMGIYLVIKMVIAAEGFANMVS